MIILFENGRLGNQLFQYNALKILFKNHRLILFGFEDLALLLGKIDALRISKFFFADLIFLIVSKLFYFLARLCIFGLIREIRDGDAYSISVRRGLLLWVFIVEDCYFQDASIVKLLKPDINLKEILITQARCWLLGLVDDLTSHQLVFVHVRRGDYLKWPRKDAPAVLDAKWYLRQMDFMRKQLRAPKFIIFSDDYYYVKDVFSGQDNIIISNNTLINDFVAMSLCCHGILSPSSYSWWASLIAQSNSNHGIFIAPNFWAGHRMKKFYPANFESGWIKYRD